MVQTLHAQIQNYSLHPTQPPDHPDSGETLTVDQMPLEEASLTRTRRRRTVATRHSVHHGERRPWRDPDVHPKDIHYKYTATLDLQSCISRYV